MCTAISYKTADHYFGRNLDLEYRYQETVTITPRKYPFRFNDHPDITDHYAIIGMATVSNGYPLYYDATNEYGLSAAGLNFPGNACYCEPRKNADNVTAFELIPWLLSQCKNVDQAKNLLKKINITNIPFSQEFALTPLHWMVSDSNTSIVIEPESDGVRIYDNPVGVLTNNPPFPFHLDNLKNYLNLTSEEPTNRFSNKITLHPYSRGMGAMGLPGDLSSASRFIRAAFTKLNSVSNDAETASVSQFFHILGAVTQQCGCVKVNGAFEKTIYSCCCNTDKGIYYYKTYHNSQISAVKLFGEDLECSSLKTFPLNDTQQIHYQN